MQSAAAIPEVRGSIVVSISACHAEDPGSIPGGGVLHIPAAENLRSEVDCNSSSSLNDFF